MKRRKRGDARARGVRRLGPALLAALMLTAACSEQETTAAPPPPPLPPLADYVDPEAELTRLRFHAGGKVSANDRCPVRRSRLNPVVAPVRVNGRPIGFC